MSKLRPSHRDRLEKQFLAKCAERFRLDAELVGMQRELDGIEAPRMPVRGGDDRKDGLDTVRPSCLAVMPDLPEDDDAPAVEDLADDDCEVEVDWQGRTLRIMALCVGILRQIKGPHEKQPKLAAHVGLLALGVDTESMHQVAAAYGLSVERVRQRAEEVRVKFNLPKNQHNKSEMAVQSYKSTARLFNQGAA